MFTRSQQKSEKMAEENEVDMKLLNKKTKRLESCLQRLNGNQYKKLIEEIWLTDSVDNLKKMNRKISEATTAVTVLKSKYTDECQIWKTEASQIDEADESETQKELMENWMEEAEGRDPGDFQHACNEITLLIEGAQSARMAELVQEKTDQEERDRKIAEALQKKEEKELKKEKNGSVNEEKKAEQTGDSPKKKDATVPQPPIPQKRDPEGANGGESSHQHQNGDGYGSADRKPNLYDPNLQRDPYEMYRNTMPWFGSGMLASEMPVFEGSHYKWRTWRLEFMKILDRMIGITEQQKFSLLKKALSRECLAHVEAYTDSEESFASAMNLLEAIYGEGALAQQELMRKIDELWPRSESPKDQLDYFVKLKPLVQELMILDHSCKSSTVFIHTLQQKFALFMRRHLIEKSMDFEQTVPNVLQEMERELIKRIRTENLLRFGETQISQRGERPNVRQHENRSYGSNMAIPRRERNENEGGRESCMLCGRHARTEDCHQVTDIAQRKAILTSKKACFKCLRTGHMAFDCAKMCSSCGGHHHVILCENRNGRNAQRQFEPRPNARETERTQRPGPIPFTRPNQSANMNAMTRENEQATLAPEAANGNRTFMNAMTTGVDEGWAVKADEYQWSLIDKGGAAPGMSTSYMFCTTAPPSQQMAPTYLFVGQARVRNRETGKAMMLPYMIDQGSMLTAIEGSVSEELELKAVGHTDTRICGAGGIQMGQSRRKIVEWEMETKSGDWMPVRGAAFDGPVLGTMSTPTISEKDRECVKAHAGKPSFREEGEQRVRPRILLGVAEYLRVTGDTSYERVPLPSGLHLVKTKIGDLIVGTRDHEREKEKAREPTSPIAQEESQMADELSRIDIGGPMMDPVRTPKVSQGDRKQQRWNKPNVPHSVKTDPVKEQSWKGKESHSKQERHEKKERDKATVNAMMATMYPPANPYQKEIFAEKRRIKKANKARMREAEMANLLKIDARIRCGDREQRC